jgi:hypothetical protein
VRIRNKKTAQRTRLQGLPVDNRPELILNCHAREECNGKNPVEFEG